MPRLRPFRRAAAPGPGRDAVLRRGIADDLHDGIAQELAFVLQQTRRLERLPGADPVLAEIARSAERAQAAVRGTIAAFTDEDDGLSVEAGLRDAAERHTRRAGAAVEVRVAGHAELSRDERDVVARTVSEATANAVRHGAARTVRIQLLISDDGTGFDLAAAAPGHGLSALQRQAAAAGGRLDVTSAPGSGTSVTAQLP